MLPLVICIDLDGTIVGDVTPIIVEWELLHSQKNNAKLMKDYKDFVIKKLCEGLIRPQFSDFHSCVKRSYPHAEIYVYTASETKWAVFLISCIEKAINIKFNQPIFTRDNCIIESGEYKKSLECVANVVKTKLKKTYPELKKPSQLKDRIILIDNNDVLIEKERNKGLRCSTYDFKYYHDVFSRINLENTYQDKDCREVAVCLNKYGMFPSLKDTSKFLTFHMFRYYYYLRLCENLKKLDNQKSPRNDKFWHIITEILCHKKINMFDNDTLKKIQKKISLELRPKKG
jgi:hypothetical protein